jgi:hypothetical protein
VRRVAVVAAVILGAVIAFVLATRGDDDPRAPAAAPARDTPARQPTPGTPTVTIPPDAPSAAAPPGPERDTHADAAPYVNPPDVQTRMQDVHAHLQDAARGCANIATPPPTSQYRFQFRVTVTNGEARVSDLDLVWSDLGSEALEACLADKLGAARWASADEGWTTTAEDAITPDEL